MVWSALYTIKVWTNIFISRPIHRQQCTWERFFYFIVAIIDSLRADIDCGCLEDCNVIKYSLQRSDTMLWFHNSSVSWTIVQTKVIYKRELIHGFVEALILTGASLSLYVGMSCLTIVEVLFYLYLYAFK